MKKTGCVWKRKMKSKEPLTGVGNHLCAFRWLPPATPVKGFFIGRTPPDSKTLIWVRGRKGLTTYGAERSPGADP